MYYAHSTLNPDKSDWQYLENHLKNVADRSQEFANDFHAGNLAYVSGLLHDIGKYSPEFQKRLAGAGIRVDHSTAGAIEVTKLFQGDLEKIGLLPAYVIAGHHGGLVNYGSNVEGLCEKLRRTKLPDFTAYQSEIQLVPITELPFKLKSRRNFAGFCYSFFTRMLYSCLVDADSLDTEQFCTPENATLRTNFESFEILTKKFEAHMQTIQSGADDSLINRERKKIFSQCIEAGSLPPGMFSLTVPTGGGKTLSSMAFALEHLKTHDLKRIFYVIPYTSIIEQNAKVFRDIFGWQNVLEHHSNFDPRTVETDELDTGKESLRLATENWDMPIVVTTNVQFFESLFSNKRSRCRKLHSLAKSVIILDEAQMLPTGFLLPCLAALSELVRNYGATVVICTATQPRLGDLLDENVKPREIMQSLDRLYEAFKRVRITPLDLMSDADLSARLKDHPQVLCIVNTRTHAKKLYETLKESGNCYHLSARMCPVHRRKKIAEIKSRLKSGDECRVISTQLIEAGVDIDFPVVYRAMTGIDSIAQAAGRCNREGKLPAGEVFIFKSIDQNVVSETSWQRRTATIGEKAIKKFEDEGLLSPDSIGYYFKELYFFEGDRLDQEGILRLLEKRSKKCRFPFEDIAIKFNLIEDGSKDLIIPYDDEAEKIINDLHQGEKLWQKIRKIQGYTISIFPTEFNEMVRLHLIDVIGDRFNILNDRRWYDPESGLLNPKDNRLEMPFLHH